MARDGLTAAAATAGDSRRDHGLGAGSAARLILPKSLASPLQRRTDKAAPVSTSIVRIRPLILTPSTHVTPPSAVPPASLYLLTAPYSELSWTPQTSLCAAWLRVSRLYATSIKSYGRSTNSSRQISSLQRSRYDIDEFSFFHSSSPLCVMNKPLALDLKLHAALKEI